MPNYRVYNSTTKEWEDTGIAFRSDLDAYAKKETGVYFVEGNTTGTAGTWTGTNDNITSLYDGLVVNYKIGIAGASTTKLNINGLGAKICYLRGTSKLTTHYAVGTMVLLAYNKTKDAFYAADYDSDAYTIRQYYDVTSNLEYPLIYSYNTDVSGTSTYKATYGAVKSGFTYNPSTDTLSVTKLKLNGTELDLSKYALASSLSSYATTTALSNLQQGLETGDIVVEEANIATKATQDGNGNNIANTYATKTDLNSYLTTTNASNTYLTKTSASSTYLTKTDASSTYATKSSLSSYIPTSKLAVANGVATLDSTGKVLSSQLPSYVDDIIEGYVGNQGAAFYEDSALSKPITLETGKIYVDLSNNRTFRWSGTVLTEISASLALGLTSSTAYSGAKGKANADNIAILQGYFTNGKAKTADVADYAKMDEDGNVIADTYALKNDIPAKVSELENDTGFITTYTNTKNTAGTTNKVSTKMFLVGATSQAANPQTFSNVNVYIGTDNCLYSNGTKVLTSHQSLSNYSTLANTIKDLSISGKTITYTKGDGTTGTLTTQDTTYTALKNPNAVTIKAGTETVSSYDGSSAKTFTIAASSTAGAFTISDGTTTKTIQLAGKFTDNNTTYESKAAASGGTAVSLVTTGEKYIWNNKSSFSGNYNDLTNKPTIPSAVTEATVSGWGFTKNAGTVTSVKVGTQSYSSNSGVVSLPAYPTTLPASDITGEWNVDGGEDNVDDAITALIGKISGLSSPTTTVIYNTYTAVVETPPAQGAVISKSFTLSGIQAGDRLKVYLNGGTSGSGATSQAGIIELELFASGSGRTVVGSGSFMSNTGGQLQMISAQVTGTALKISVFGMASASYASYAKVYLYKVERVR